MHATGASAVFVFCLLLTHLIHLSVFTDMIIVNPGIGDHLSVFTEEIPVTLIAEPVRGFAVAFIIEIVGTVL